MPQADNLLKPDLVAPGNKVDAALAADRAGSTGSWNYLATLYPALAAPWGGRSQHGKTALSATAPSARRATTHR